MGLVRRDDTRNLVIGVLSSLIATAILVACGIIWHWFKNQAATHVCIYLSITAFALGIIGEVALLLIRARMRESGYRGDWRKTHAIVTTSSAFLLMSGWVSFDVFLYLWGGRAWLGSIGL